MESEWTPPRSGTNGSNKVTVGLTVGAARGLAVGHRIGPRDLPTSVPSLARRRERTARGIPLFLSHLLTLCLGRAQRVFCVCTHGGGRGKPRVGGEESGWAWPLLPSIVRHWRSLGEEALPGRSGGVAKQRSRPSRVSHLSIVLSSAVARSSFSTSSSSSSFLAWSAAALSVSGRG